MSYNTILATAPLTTQNYHLKMIGTSIGNSLIWDNGTNVGIGNTNTSYTLDVSGTGRFTGNGYVGGNLGIGTLIPSGIVNGLGLVVYDTNYPRVILQNSTTGTGTGAYSGLFAIGSDIYFGNSSATGKLYFAVNSSSSAMSINSAGGVSLEGYLTGKGTNPGGLGGSRYVLDWLSGSMRIFSYGADASTNGGFVFNSQRSDGTNSFNPMTITSAGNVGIGTTAPIGPLDIAFPVADGATISASNAQTAYNYSRLRIKHYSGSNLGLSIGYAGANYTYIQACYNEGTAAPLLLNPFSGNVTINNAITNAQLSVGNSGGNWGVMVQDFVANGALMKFHSSDGTSVGSITYNGSVIVYATTSDYRLKEDFKDINGLDKISAIKVYDFKFKNSGKRMDGVIAHELQEVIPYAVYGEKNALNEDGNIHAQGVDYSLLTPVLVKAIQEMNTKLDEQNQTIQNLQEQINILAK